MCMCSCVCLGLSLARIDVIVLCCVVLFFSSCLFVSSCSCAAVDTFLKIAQKCRKKFVQVQQGESITFIEELCTTLPSIIADLETHQVRT